MRRTYKYRLYSTRAQSDKLHSQVDEACRLYNAALDERRLAWEMNHVSLNFYDQSKQLPSIRASGNLDIVNAQVAQDVLHRIDKAFKSFFSRFKIGAKPGYPRFRSRSRYNSITFPQYTKGVSVHTNMRLYLQGIGEVKVFWHRQIPNRAKIKTVTVLRQAKNWYVCFSVELDNNTVLPESTLDIGIDVGLATFAVTSENSEITNPCYYRSAEHRLRIAQRKLARRQKRSRRRQKARLELAKVHAHIANQRCDFHHKVSHELVQKYGLIAVEDLNVKGLASGLLAKSVHDAGWAQFIQFLTYKAEEAGRILIKVNPRGTTQDCSSCGVKVPKTLSDRWHNCQCGLSISRDFNAAINILNRARMEPSGANDKPLPVMAS